MSDNAAAEIAALREEVAALRSALVEIALSSAEASNALARYLDEPVGVPFRREHSGLLGNWSRTSEARRTALETARVNLEIAQRMMLTDGS